ncbi:MAG: SH3 domain-containing protein [Clostridia bacterium]|nr:SH3 domain-containing protein [Clostridia bacterium]
MEENNNTYTYQRNEKKEETSQSYNRRLIMLFIAAIALIIVLGAVLGKYLGMRSAQKQSETTAPIETESQTEEPTSEVEPSALYSEGEYTVSTGGSSLKFRKSYSLDSDVILEIKEGTKLVISEVYHDENAAANGSSVEYWGKTTYYGYEGWVAMNYLKNAFSDSIVTPDEIASTEAPSSEPSSSTESTTAAPSSEPASGESGSSESTSSSAENTTAQSSSKYAPGNYSVSTGGSTLSFRKSASPSGNKLADIPDGTKVTVKNVVDAGGSDETRRYWGEIEYNGQTGYVSMYYLSKVS